MELNDVQVYLAIAGMTAGFLTALITGAKWVYHRWSTSLDARILDNVCDEIGPMKVTIQEHSGKLEALEKRFNDFWRYLKPGN